jgi:hypothetical protein
MKLKGEMFVIEANVFKLTVGMVLTFTLGVSSQYGIFKGDYKMNKVPITN